MGEKQLFEVFSPKSCEVAAVPTILQTAITVPDLTDLSIQTAQSIDFSCYKMSEKVEWCLDSGCTDHIIPSKSNFVQYRELGQASKA